MQKYAALLLLPALAGGLGCSKSDKPDPSTPPPSCTADAAAAASREACAFHAGALPTDTFDACSKLGSAIPIEHIVVLMMENRSFDHYLGHLPGNGQDDVDVPPDGASNPSAIAGDPPVPWHHAEALCFKDTDHEWFPSHAQYDNGKNDGFAITNGQNDPTDPSGSRALSYYTADDIPFYYKLASTFAISDRYFAALLGPTFPNRLYLYSGTSAGLMDNQLKPGLPTIFKLLMDAGISFKLYSTDVSAAYITYLPAADLMVPIAQFAIDAAAGTLPQVTFLDPEFLSERYSTSSEHPPADIQVGEQFVRAQVLTLMSSPNWKDSAMFITYDEHGGIYDHVPPPPACAPDDIPPEVDAGGGGGEAGATGTGSMPTFDRYGFRVPVYVVSPYAKPHFVSHQIHSHTSIIRFIEARFGLPALTNRDANADAMLDMFDFDAPPAFLVPPALPEAPLDQTQLQACQAKFPG